MWLLKVDGSRWRHTARSMINVKDRSLLIGSKSRSLGADLPVSHWVNFKPYALNCVRRQAQAQSFSRQKVQAILLGAGQNIASLVSSMESRSPSVACIGIIGRNNNPLHISLFPAVGTGSEAQRDKLEFSFMLNSCLDIFEARMPTKGLTQDFGLLHALDERLAMYGWLTNTGVKFVIVIDMDGVPSEGVKTAPGLGLRNSDLTPVRV